MEPKNKFQNTVTKPIHIRRGSPEEVLELLWDGQITYGLAAVL